MAIYPNPANEELNIATVNDSQGDTDENSMSEQTIDEKNLADVNAVVQLLDKDNKIIRQGKLQKGKITFKTTDLPSDTYFLRFDNGKKTIKKQVIIQH